uniref:Uncharacterized protein n=1 Tax=Otus sunia TaxID=257818 RepID=A0A8C8AXP1_9STRI
TLNILISCILISWGFFFFLVGSCLITYWKHSPWLAAITCPLCRQKVVLLENVSCEKQQDEPSKQIVHDIRDYNKRFSGQPRPVSIYKSTFTQLVVRNTLRTEGPSKENSFVSSCELPFRALIGDTLIEVLPSTAGSSTFQ